MAYAISSDGELVWSLALRGRPQGSPSIGRDGTIYFSMSELHAVSAQGSLLWSFTPTGDEISGTAALGSDGSVYVAAESVGLYALGSGGCIRWTFEKTGTSDAKTSPAIGPDGTLYFGIDEAIVAVSPDGQERWRHTLGDVEHLSPLIGPDGTVYAVTGAGITALSAEGAVEWSIADATGGAQFPASISAESQIYLPAQRELRAIDAAGSELWSFDSQWSPTPVIDSNGVAYISDSFCLATAISKDGRTLWSHSFSQNGCGSPILAGDGTLYFSSPNDGIIAVRDP
jgi:outer membrane protein assembly factor BamB